MIITVTPNPCNDLTWSIEHFCYAGMNRIQSQRLDFAGKGFNVAKALQRLGGESVVATGFLYDENGEASQKALQSEGVKVDCVWKPGRIRTNTKLFDCEKNTITEFNESGIEAGKEDVQELFDKIIALAKESRFLIMSGSLPPGCPNDFYANVIAACQLFPCKIALDAEGEKLLLGIEQKPALIKPNLFELETAVGRKLEKLSDIQSACDEIIEKGVEIVLLSLGSDGAYISNGCEQYKAGPVKGIQVRGTVGAGDSMLAAAVLAWEKNLPLAEIFRWSVASATACVVQEGTGLVTKALFEEYLPQVEIEKL